MTSTGHRHPLFGDRSHWYGENDRNPSRTGWSDRAVDEVADDAGNELLNRYVGYIAQHSEYFHV